MFQKKNPNKRSTFSFQLFPRKAFIVSFSIQIRQMKFLQYVSVHRISPSFLRYTILQYVSIHQLAPNCASLLVKTRCLHASQKIIFCIALFSDPQLTLPTQLENSSERNQFRHRASRLLKPVKDRMLCHRYATERKFSLVTEVFFCSSLILGITLNSTNLLKFKI